MSGAPAGLNAQSKEAAATFQGSLKRQSRERPVYAPIKKRVMAEMNLKRKHVDVPFRTAKIKKEHVEGEGEGGQEEVKGKEKKDDRERRWSEETDDRSGKQYAGGGALDLSPGLKHTLAQFTLSSQSSLGGPAAFSARGVPGVLAPLPSPPVLGGGPLLVPCDSSTELTHSLLEGESITSFMVGGVKRLCLPQVLNSVLRQFSLQQINAVCDELYIYCSRCDGEQLHILKVLGILPFNAPSCGLITLTDAQRLCNALLRPGAALPPPLDPGGGGGGGKLREGETSFRVEHQCLGKCQGVFATHLYTHPDAPCIQCVQCHLLFAPQRFVMHSHRSPDKRTCHWGFDSARWARYLHLGRKHLGTPREAELRRLLEEVKEKFHCSQKKVPLDTKDGAEDHAVKKGSDVCSQNETHCDRELEQKAKSHPTHVLKPPLSPDIKEESGFPASTLHRSCLLYMYDKVGARAPALGKEGAQLSVDILEALYRQHHSGNQRRRPSQDLGDTDVTSSPASGRHRTCGSASGEGNPPSWFAAMETAQGEDSCSVPLREEDKDRMVLEVLQMYYRQQEVLQSTLQKHRQLEMELETLRRGGTVIQGEPQREAEVHTEHAQERDLEDCECAQKKECSEPALKKKCTKTQKNGEEHPGHAQSKGKDTQCKGDEHTEHAQSKEGEFTEHAQSKGGEQTEHAQTKDKIALCKGDKHPEDTQRTGGEHTEHAQSNGGDCSEHAQSKGSKHNEHVQSKGEELTEHAESNGEDQTMHAQTNGGEHTGHAQSERGEHTAHAQSKEGDPTEHVHCEGEEPAVHAQGGGGDHTGHAQSKEEVLTEHAQSEKETTGHALDNGEELSEHAQGDTEECTERAQDDAEGHTKRAQGDTEKRMEPARDDTEERTEQDDMEGRTEDGRNKDKSDPDLRSENLKPQTCTCQLSMEQSQRAQHYASQLLELRRRLDRAEEDRAELQEELRRERDARRKLELVISQLRLQTPSQPLAPETEPHTSPPRQD